MEIDSHIAVAMSGLTADANTLIDHARVESQYHRFTYAEPMDVESLTQSICDYSMRFGEGGDDDGDDKPKMVAPMPLCYTIGSCKLPVSLCLAA
jgi:20S proteasome subunit alpha 5